jgi:hypothetical protein
MRRALVCVAITETGDGEVVLISCVVVVDPEVTFGLERERHSAVLCKGVIHLCMGSCLISSRVCAQGFGGGHT